MKTRNKIITAIIFLATILQGCTDEYMTINGEGPLVNRTLSIPQFSSIAMEGVDDVHIYYGESLNVEVVGQSNIISRIKKNVYGDTWYIELEKGRYGHYDLSYYITLPRIEEIDNRGTGNVIIESDFLQEEILISLTGTGNYYGFSLEADEVTVDITGTGYAEVSANTRLDVSIEGTGKVYYKGNPLIHSSISGTGRLIDAN